MLLFKTYLFITPGKRYEYNKLKIKAPTQNYEFELPGSLYSLSDIQGYIGYIIKKYETLPTNPPIHIYNNRTNNRLVFKVKDEYNIALRPWNCLETQQN